MKIRWSQLSAYTRTRFPGSVTLLPVLGYAVLFSDQLNSWLFDYGEFLQGGWLNPRYRILLIFLGAILLAIGRLLFFACPKSIQQFPSIDSYVGHHVSHPDRAEIKESLDNIKNHYPEIQKNTVPVEDSRTIGAQPYHLVVKRVQNVDSGTWVKDSGSESRAVVLRASYEIRDAPTRKLDIQSMWFCFGFYTLGTAVFLLPSLEVTMLALGQVIEMFWGLI